MKKVLEGLRLGRALRLVWEYVPGWTMASVALLLVQGLLPLASLYLFKLVVDAAVESMATAGQGIDVGGQMAAYRQVGLLIAAAGAVHVLSAVVRAVAGLVSEERALRFTDRMSECIHKKSVEVDLAYYESAQYYDTLHRAQRQGANRPNAMVDNLVRVAQNGISLLGLAGLLAWLQPEIALVLCLSVLPGIAVRILYANKMYRRQREWTPAERKSWYLDWLLTGDQHAKEVRLFGLGPLLMERYRRLRVQLRGERLALTRRRALADLGAKVLAALALFGCFALVAYRTVQGRVTPGELVLYFQAFQRGQGALSQVLTGIASLYEDSLYLNNLYEFLDLQPKVVEPARPKALPKRLLAGSESTGIAFEEVGFQYLGGTEPVLRDVSLTVRPGEHVALVGENGSGKTTLIKLLCRLYDPTDGRITLDGTDLRDLRTETLRRQIGVIFQDYARYQLTARENVWFGDVERPGANGEVEAAARIAGADEVIRGLPKGYESVLGKWFKDGRELSIGQWQKVALARAFFRDAPILILDEPTSALDARAEYEVFERFRQLAHGRTAILISHRFSTVRLADRIFVLEDGQIVERGTHEELVLLGGKYARLFEIQAQHYR